MHRKMRALLCCLLAGAGVEATADAGPSPRPSQSKQEITVPVARKVAEWKEAFTVGGMDFSFDGRQLATNAAVDGLDVHLWEWRGGGRLVRVLHKDAAAGEGNALRFSPDGTLLAVGHVGASRTQGRCVVRIWDSRTGEVVHDIAASRGGSGFFESLAFSPDGKFLVRTVDGGGEPGDYVVAYRTDTWEQVWGIDTRPLFPRTLAISPDGRWIAVAGATAKLGPQGPPIVFHPKIAFFRVADRSIVRTIDAAFSDDTQIHSLSWSPDGTLLAAGALVHDSEPGADAVRIFQPTTGKVLLGESADTAYVNGLSYSPDGRYLVEGYVNGTVRIWDGTHKHLLQTIAVDDHFHTVLRVSRDSRYLAIAAGNAISLWELKQVGSAF